MNANLNCKQLTIEVKRLREEVLSLTQSKNELLTYKQQLDAIMDNAPVEVILKDREGRYLRVNKHCENIFGVKNNDLLGMLPADIHEDTLATASQENDQFVLKSGKAKWCEEITELVGDSLLHTLSAIQFPIFNGDGEINGVGAIISDITEKVLIKDKLLKKNALFGMAEQFSKLGHWEWDEIAGGYITCSEQYASIFGKTVEQVVGDITNLKEDKFRVCVEDRDRYNQVLDVAREGKKRWEVEYRSYSTVGKQIYLHEIGEPVLDNHGVVIKTVGVIQDVTERKRAEELAVANEQIEKSKQAQNQFLSQMSHELRTPLHAVTGLSKALVSDKAGLSREKKDEYLGQIHDSGQHLLQIIGDILDLSKLNADARYLEKRPFTITEVIDACRSTFNLSCQNKGISFIIENQLAGAYTVLGDITALKQILFNLLSNAVKFTESGTITLAVTPHTGSDFDPSITFIISDTGKGISTEAIPLLFNRFTQEDSSITRSFGGSGLGLTISQNLVNLMGGNITCTSSVGKGSQFEFTVSLGPQHESIDENSSDDLDSYKLPPLKVLLVDDLALNLMVGAALLEPKGHAVATASSGQKAVEMASNNDYDIILMDVHMPDMDGMEATKAIRNSTNKRRAAVPIVALSADVEVGNQASFIASGMSATLSKSSLAKGFDKELQRILKLT